MMEYQPISQGQVQEEHIITPLGPAQLLHLVMDLKAEVLSLYFKLMLPLFPSF